MLKMRKQFFYFISFFLFLGSLSVFAAQEGSTPPSPSQKGSGPPPPGLPIDDWIPALLIGTAFAGSYYISKKRKQNS